MDLTLDCLTGFCSAGKKATSESSRDLRKDKWAVNPGLHSHSAWPEHGRQNLQYDSTTSQDQEFQSIESIFFESK